MPTSKSLYPYAVGQNIQGYDIKQNQVVVGSAQFQGGQYSFLPAITAPGTVASGGTVSNSTGMDCMVYLSATSGIGAVKLLSYNGANATSYSVGGTVTGAATLPVIVTGPGAIAVTYTGTLTWVWVPK